MVGSLGNLYGSIQNLSTNYLQPNFNKDCILSPQVPSIESRNDLQINSSGLDVDLFSPKVNRSVSPSYKKPQHRQGTVPLAILHGKKRGRDIATKPTSTELKKTSNSVSSASEEKGFVKGVVTYTVMDDLVVKPMSSISNITFLKSFNIKNIGALQEKEINFGMAEAVKLIKASLESKTVLTDAFLLKKRSRDA